MAVSVPLSPVIPDPSLSRSPSVVQHNPTLLHTLHQEHSSVLSLAADDRNIYTGSQDGQICVWDKHTFKLRAVLSGHTGSILALEYAPEKRWLFSASGDSTIRVWNTRSLNPLHILHPHLETDSGDLFSLAWCPHSQTLYFGCQNTSLQWFVFPVTTPELLSSPPSLLSKAYSSSGISTPPSRKAHKFFDSYPRYTRRPADLNARNPTCASCVPATSTTPPSGSSTGSLTPPDPCIHPDGFHPPVAIFQVPPENVIDSAHYGYVYCMALLPSYRDGSDDPPFESGRGRQLQLVTGSGDSTVKLWRLPENQSSNDAPRLIHTFDCGVGAVLALVVRGDTVFAGCQDGLVKVWDLETRTLVRTLLVVENVDILSMSMLHSDLYVCSANGDIQRWSSAFVLTGSWKGHEGIVLSSIITPKLHTEDPVEHATTYALVTGANDNMIKVWEVFPPAAPTSSIDNIDGFGDHADVSRSIDDLLVHALTKFVSIPSVSSSQVHKEDCRQAAIWLRKCLTQLGAEASLLPTGDATNPLVMATFRGTQTSTPKPRVLFYGHYDVISAQPSGWTSDPFTLTGRNGYLYGRGATDNKGPVMAVACAAAELLARRALGADLVLLVEGEEEAGSGGFVETVKRHKETIGPIDSILVSNSTWIAEDTPCITYGLRGVVHCNVEISNEGPDLHSGVDGGAAREPMLDMVKLLGTLTDESNRIVIPNFYDNVRPLTEEERQSYKVLSSVTQTPATLLVARWREPSLTVHNVEVSGPRNSTVIPSSVKAHVSLRIVPDQALEAIASSVREHLEATFKRMRSPNHLKVSIEHTADWWLGNLDDPWFHALEDAVRDEWQVEPLRIREGGSIPSVPYLEKEFSCHALHLPLGQSTDQAHLPDERISLSNLQRGKRVVERFLSNVAGLSR
ncbi:Zn-dependent exopeptidase [Dichomitus squalens LYAD-421 SS1]|uniref:Zn-dependent exopeptidase n=2 Tax=Dichomitus squalens TaxID=114155 RepID=A0A4Q9MI50_9APHY|nr:Zn-dependent exopeptidase [Dichomitus squalens LYAD-421 SS1]EJF61051.1 Zn-dependent exopeptidase [Dichomitus squalens LYAD-421 SS1]TBU27065.1 Zn-dependent exopeptidase [Dichomitus squalens]TBU56592.1 Zn-dependent exopeptidase [Dichomitus squalens]